MPGPKRRGVSGCSQPEVVVGRPRPEDEQRLASGQDAGSQPTASIAPRKAGPGGLPTIERDGEAADQVGERRQGVVRCHEDGRHLGQPLVR